MIDLLSSPLMQLIPRISRPFILVLLFALTACGVPGPGGSNNFNDPSRGSNGPDADVFSVPVIAEGTPEMFDSNETGENIITADNIDCQKISVIQLNFDMSEIVTAPNVPEVTSKKRATYGKENTPGCKLEFVENFEPRIDAVIRVEYPNNEVLYAPLRRAESEDISIVVSFGSHLAVETLFSKITDSIELAKHLPCTGNTDCQTQHRAKARLLSFIADTARLYEFNDDIKAGQTAAEALTLLKSKSDLMSHLNTAANEIVRSESPIAKGTVRESYDRTLNPDINNGILQSRLQPTNTYNSVFFAMGLLEDTPSSSDSSLDNKLITASSHIADSISSDKLPQLIHNAYFLDYRYDDVLPNIPFEMSSLRFKTNSKGFLVDPALPENRYAFITAPEQENGSIVNGTHLSSQGFFLNDRAIAQNLTELPFGVGSTGVGYDFNPVYYKLYRGNEYEPNTTLDSLIQPEDPEYGDSPTWLSGTGYGLTNVFEIKQTQADPVKYARQDILETQRYFSWEIHGLRTSDQLLETDINGPFDVLEFSIDLDNRGSTDDRIIVRGETLIWDRSGSSFVERQNSAFYSTRELARDKNNAFIQRSDFARVPTPSDSSRPFYLYDTDLVDENNNTYTGPNGLITLDGETRSTVPLGHVSENGNHMAFAIEKSSFVDRAKRGIILASKQRNTPIDLVDGNPLDFTLSGHYFFMDAQTHQLVTVDESTLSIAFPTGAEDCDASITVERIKTTHQLDSTPIQGEISDPVNESMATEPSTACTLSNGQVEIRFQLAGNELILRGFAMIEDGALGKTVKQINLLWLQDNAIGLVFAQLDQQLSAEFEN